MNIVELLKAKENTVTLLYYGKNDMASGFQVKTLIDNFDDINNYYNTKTLKIDNLDDYIDYIFIDTFSQLKEILPMVRDDLKKKVSTAINDIIAVKERYKKRDINKYIKNNYEIILSREKLKQYELRAYEIIEYSLNYIKSNFQYFKENYELYKYIVENYAYKIFYNFNDYRDIFMKYPELNDVLFSKQIIEGQMSTKIKDLKDALKMIKKNNVKLFKDSIGIVYNMVKKRSFNTDIEKVMYTYDDIKETMRLFEALGENALYDEFNEELKKQDIILNDYIVKNGYHSKFEISINDLVKVFEDEKLSWEIKSLMITHTRRNNKMCSRIQSAIENKVQSQLIDKIGSTNIDVNDYFTYSVQNHLSITMILGKLMINYMLSDDYRFKELINYMFAGIANYIEQNNIDIPNIDDDFNMLNYALKNLLIENQKEERDNLVCEYWNYNVLHLSIGIIEKVLREICYKFIIVNKYIPYKNLTIDNILSLPETENFMGQANIRAFRYYLTSYNTVGKNLRNDICHYNNNIKEICTYENVLEVIYILLTISNELLLKIIEKK
ncbi:MAG TPA: hypothetical protein IAD08_06070 [Candidatus Scatovivens faecipullorum]|nr:hypothetical protein [Candidatus Scatovivens faecipullorum]